MFTGVTAPLLPSVDTDVYISLLSDSRFLTFMRHWKAGDSSSPGHRVARLITSSDWRCGTEQATISVRQRDRVDEAHRYHSMCTKNHSIEEILLKKKSPIEELPV